jgi:hypothetical protein
MDSEHGLIKKKTFYTRQKLLSSFLHCFTNRFQNIKRYLFYVFFYLLDCRYFLGATYRCLMDGNVLAKMCSLKAI